MPGGNVVFMYDLGQINACAHTIFSFAQTPDKSLHATTLPRSETNNLQSSLPRQINSVSKFDADASSPNQWASAELKSLRLVILRRWISLHKGHGPYRENTRQS